MALILNVICKFNNLTDTTARRSQKCEHEFMFRILRSISRVTTPN